MTSTAIDISLLKLSDIPFASLMKPLRKGYLEYPYKPLIIDPNESMSYFEAFRRASALAVFLRDECNIDSTKTVMFSSLNVTDYVVVIAAVQQCRARLVLCTGSATDSEIVNSALAVHPDLMIVGKVEHCDLLKQEFPAVKVISLRCFHPSFDSVENIIAKSNKYDRLQLFDEEGDSEIVLFSSGSTGKPKAIVNRSSSFYLNGKALDKAFSISEDDVCYSPVPFSHTYGVVTIYAALLAGATLVTLVKYRPETSLSVMVGSNASIYFGVPTMFLRELRVNESGGWDLSCLRSGMVAGATCPESALLSYEERFGCVLVQSYGMTETAATLTIAPLESPLAFRAKSVGAPIEGAAVKIDPLNGEVLCKSASLMEGVLREDGSVDLALDNGWFRTGDTGYLDEKGFLYITGRIKDIVIRGGINIFPAEIENVYQKNAEIAESCLIGYPDPELGERTCLCVVMNESATSSSNDLRLYAKGHVEKCKIPDVVLKMKDLPRLPNGKIDKNTLRSQVRDRLNISQRSIA